MYYGSGDNPHDGIFFIHKDKDGEQCVETYDLKPADDTHQYADDGKWHIASTDPDKLTMMPSIICTKCGEHGYIRDGRWSDPFELLPQVPICEIFADTVPAPDHGNTNWESEKTWIAQNCGPQISELASSLVKTRTFYNPIVIRDGVVVEGRVRLFTAYIMGFESMIVHYATDDKHTILIP